MPNYVYTSLEVSGSKEELAKFKEKASKPYKSDGITEAGDLLFWNFVRPESIEWWDKNWYEWNIENWGTKWDACESTLCYEDEYSLSYSFSTAWDLPRPVFEAMAKQHPKLSFHAYCQEEQGWGEELEARDGVLVTTDIWDIPESHADCALRHVTCACSWADEPIDYYPDCPDYVEPTEEQKAESKRQEEEYLAKMRETIVKKSGVSEQWADAHLIVTGVK